MGAYAVYIDGALVDAYGYCYGYVDGSAMGRGVDGALTADHSCQAGTPKGGWGAFVEYEYA